MRYLLDTHTLLWFLQDAPELPAVVAERIEASNADNHVSIASAWEMAIKIGLGRLRVPYSLDVALPQILRENGFTVLPVRFEHLQTVAGLQYHHRDPFDRLLVAQAQVEELAVLSQDTALDAYGVRRIWT